jgi:hypothetical protein
MNAPSEAALAAQLANDKLPEYASLASTSSCADVRSSAEGATPARCSPPLNVRVIAAEGLAAVHTAVPLTLVYKHEETLPLSVQPLLTVPLGQSVQEEELLTHKSPTKPSA